MLKLTRFDPSYGETLQPGVRLSTLNTSSATIYALVNSLRDVPDDRLPLFCHARDVADAHVKWLVSDNAPSQRYLLFGGAFNWAMAVEHIAATRPELIPRLPHNYEEAVANKKDPKNSYATLDTTAAETHLGMTFKNWKETLDASLDSLLGLEKQPDWKD